MPRFAIIENKKVVNIIEAEPAFAAEIGAVQIMDPAVSIGWGYAHKKFTAPELQDRTEEIRSAALASVDRLAEEERLKYITGGSGQAMTYFEKANEARRYIDSDGAGSYIFLPKEVGITGADLSEVASVILAKYEEWQAVGSDIEEARLRAKRDIESATSEKDINDIVLNLSF